MDKSKSDPHSQKQRPVLPLQTRVRLFLLNAVINASLRRDATVNRRPFQILRSLLTVPASTKPRNGARTSDVVVDSSRDLWFRLYVPTTATDGRNLPVVVFFHGGGFVLLSPDFKEFDNLCRRFASGIPAVIVSVNYRLAPENRYPCQYEDGLDVLKFLDGCPNQLLPENVDVSRCFVAGDSAGGNLAHHVAVRACQHKFTQLKVSQVDFPATLVVVGGFDSLKDWQRRYYEWLKRSGKEVYLVEYPNSIHVFYFFKELPEFNLLISEAKHFIQKQFLK